MTDCSDHDLVDVAIVGAGPAGLTAAMYAARAGLNTVVWGDPYASLLAKARVVENYPTWTNPETKGLELIDKFIDHATQYGAVLDEQEIRQIVRGEGEHSAFQLFDAEGRASCANTVIIASGTKHKRLGIKGEEEFYARGVGYCTICDGPLYKEAPVAIVGFGNEAATAALRMADIASEVFLLATKARVGADPELVDEIDNTENIIFCENIKPLEIIGGDDKTVTAFRFDIDGMIKTIQVKAVFVEVGVTPSSALVAGLGVELNGQFVQVGTMQATNINGVFAAGDITGGIARQAIVSAGDGARAAIGAIDYLKRTGLSSKKLKTIQWGYTKAKMEAPTTSGQQAVAGELYAYVHADKGFVASYERYTPRTEIITSIREICKLKGHQITVTIVSAHWCPDCRRGVPKMARIAEYLPEWEFHIENRDSNGIRDKYNIRKIPTFIISNKGKELGRIIEVPKLGSFEEDLFAIVKEEYP
ncbi:MAG: FAD-dependent oxidoreductase [Candidatus Heimdallarchaeota archaeon]